MAIFVPFPKGIQRITIDDCGKRKNKQKTTSKTKSSRIKFYDCKSYFKNVKSALPEKYKKYSKENLELLFQRIEQANPSINLYRTIEKENLEKDVNVCIWIVEELKRGNIEEEELEQVKKYLIKYLRKYLRSGINLPNFYLNFPSYSNDQLVKDTVDKM